MLGCHRQMNLLKRNVERCFGVKTSEVVNWWMEGVLRAAERKRPLT